MELLTVKHKETGRHTMGVVAKNGLLFMRQDFTYSDIPDCDGCIPDIPDRGPDIRHIPLIDRSTGEQVRLKDVEIVCKEDIVF